MEHDVRRLEVVMHNFLSRQIAYDLQQLLYDHSSFDLVYFSLHFEHITQGEPSTMFKHNTNSTVNF